MIASPNPNTQVITTPIPSPQVITAPNPNTQAPNPNQLGIPNRAPNKTQSLFKSGSLNPIIEETRSEANSTHAIVVSNKK